MIEIRATLNDREDIVELHVQNHGRDIVCAAVSALVLNAVNSIEQLASDDFSLTLTERGGNIDFRFTKVEEQGVSHDGKLLMRSLMLGLDSVCEKHPDEVTINFEEKDYFEEEDYYEEEDY
jgi:uncharacterized protein YsxB (DUF464 family)